MAFPTTSLLDDFNRADTGPPPSGSWDSAGLDLASSALSVVSNTCKSANTGGGAWGTTFGPDSEVYTTLATLMGANQRVRLYLRAQQTGGATLDGYMVDFQRVDANPGCDMKIFRIDNDANTQLGSTVSETGGALVTGNELGADVVGTTITGYIFRSGAWGSVISNTGDANYGSAGLIGMASTDSTARMDDFSGGTTAAAAAPVTARPFDAIPFI